MSSEKARFRVRTANFELEFEGPAESAWARYEAMVSSLKLSSSTRLAYPESKEFAGPKDKRGGIRANVIAKALDQLISEEWFKTKRSENSILDELRNRLVPGVERHN